MSERRAGGLCLALAVGCGGTERQLPPPSPRPICSAGASPAARGSSSSESSGSWTSIDTMNTRIDLVTVRSGIESISGGLAGCRQRHIAKGVVSVRMTVAPSGCVAAVTLASAPDPQLGECVVEAVRTAAFPATDIGGTFTYPFRF